MTRRYCDDCGLEIVAGQTLDIRVNIETRTGRLISFECERLICMKNRLDAAASAAA